MKNIINKISALFVSLVMVATITSCSSEEKNNDYEVSTTTCDDNIKSNNNAVTTLEEVLVEDSKDNYTRVLRLAYQEDNNK